MSALRHALDRKVTQAEFAELAGISQQRVSEFIVAGVLDEGDTALAWVQAYVARLHDQAAARLGEGDGLDLVQERAWLAREQRNSYRIKNAAASSEFAPTALLTDVLAFASASVVGRIDALLGELQEACPDLPSEASDAISRVIASARAEWIRASEGLEVKRFDQSVEWLEDPADTTGTGSST